MAVLCVCQIMEESLKLLLDNPSEAFHNAAKILLQCTSNILREPDNIKYRRIRISKVQNQLLPVTGAIECLFNVGFEEDGEFFTLPKSVPLDNMKKLHDLLISKQQLLKPISPSGSSSGQSSAMVDQSLLPIPVTMQSESTFYNQMTHHVDKVENYLRPGVLDKARAYVPLSQLRKNAEESFRHLGQGSGGVEDHLLIELLGWFKESFFRWMNSPTCSACNGPTESCGHIPPTAEEMAYQAGRVENYRCVSAGCGTFTRFPRFNDPVKLLETRVGRCGEWANCFTLICLAAGLEARFVVDWTDHVWTEVYSTALNRWIHADPCENACDKPLLYEAGWGKKLSYAIAFSPDDVQDVTWRYTSQPSEVLGRRSLCREPWLVQVIMALRKQAHERRQLSEQRRATLLMRTISELVEMLGPNSAKTEGLGGRTTGSLEWKQARGEIGKENFVSHIIRPTSQEVVRKLLQIKYSCSEDKYYRDESADVSGWRSMAFETQDIFRKTETDWKMVYLARCEGKTTGSLKWQFDLGSHGVCVDKIEIKVIDKCFENGRVRWLLCGDEQCVMVKCGDGMTCIDSLAGCSKFTLSVELLGGVGQHAWQHAQLFRQQLGDAEFPLHIKIHLK